MVMKKKGTLPHSKILHKDVHNDMVPKEFDNVDE